ncbi:transmembrane protein 241 isoform X3 [Eptesicus fuscus]|uniref:transmembrane protein 241 isoform X3 n=1 Tax=Eptesicus fuscus TaxID=29078 RepID=UPI002403F15C|nr:transmembrane protein 241 isoform X3 [Eptesicus fuscus]
MCGRRGLVGLTFCTCYLASHLTNKYVLSVLRFTCPTLFQGYDVLAWLPASVLFVGTIYAGSRALSRLAVPVFLTLHNAAEVIVCGHRICFRKEKTPPAKICSALLLLAAAGSLPFNDAQFDPDGYFWAVIHLLCVGTNKNKLTTARFCLLRSSVGGWSVSKHGGKRPRSLCQRHSINIQKKELGAYKVLQKSPKPSALSDIDQQYLNYIFSVALLASAAHPTGDLLRAQDFPFLYFYRFHGSCCASGLVGFLLTLSALKLKSLVAPGQCAAWLFVAQVATAGSSVLLFEGVLTRAAVGCLLLGGLGEALLVFAERRGAPR